MTEEELLDHAKVMSAERERFADWWRGRYGLVSTQNQARSQTVAWQAWVARSDIPSYRPKLKGEQ